jgi:hypothetical protein
VKDEECSVEVPAFLLTDGQGRLCAFDFKAHPVLRKEF